MCTTSKLRKDLSSTDLINELVESLDIHERYPTVDVAAKIEAILEKALEEANIPDPDDFVEWADGDRWLQENDVVRTDDIKDLVEKGDIQDMANLEDLEGFVKNDELDDALDTLNVVRTTDLVGQLAQRGFFGRMKWLLLGR